MNRYVYGKIGKEVNGHLDVWGVWSLFNGDRGMAWYGINEI